MACDQKVFGFALDLQMQTFSLKKLFETVLIDSVIVVKSNTGMETQRPWAICVCWRLAYCISNS
jgi:hypothetical protein